MPSINYKISIPASISLYEKLTFDNHKVVDSASSCFKILNKADIIMTVAFSVLISSAFFIAISECNLKGRIGIHAYLVTTTAYAISGLILSIRTNSKIENLATFWKQKVSRSGMLLKDLPACLHNQKDIVFAAIKNDPLALQYAPLLFKYDEDIVSYAIKHAPASKQFLPYKVDIIEMLECGFHND